jgi:hypothetical protein
MSQHYRHTQVGWVILGVIAAILAFVWSRLPPEAAVAAGFPLLLVAALTLLVFSALTVEVDAEAIRLRFGIGLVRKRIPIGEVKGWREVRNPWYTGWGIRLGPGYVLWNVSGRDAVELALAGGRGFRIGTDQPAELTAAISRAKGEAPAWPPPGFDGPSVDPRREFGWKPLALVLVPLLGLVGVAFWLQMQPPRVTVRPDGMEVQSLFYGKAFPASDVTSISLLPTLPPVLARTNGFAGAGSLRGHFRVEGLGDGRLFVEQRSAPYVLVRLREGFVVVSFREPERTRALYEELARAWPDRVVAHAP